MTVERDCGRVRLAPPDQPPLAVVGALPIVGLSLLVFAATTKRAQEPYSQGLS